MSSPELRDDEYNFLNYTIKNYELGNGPPLISKKSRLLLAATNNDLPTLKELLDSSKWYEVRDELGLNLLQIAILRENDEIFDYLLSLEDFPLEAVNDDGDTALVVALSYYGYVDPEEVRYDGLLALRPEKNQWMMGCRSSWYNETLDGRYAYELLKKGVNIDTKGEPLLHCALKRGFLDIAQLLIERGADINERNYDGMIPLQVFDDDETIALLLCYGANPSKRIAYSDETLLDRYLSWEIENLSYGCWPDLLENLLYFTHDKWNLCRVDGNSLLKLAKDGSPAFPLLINFTPKIIITRISHISASHCLVLLSINPKYLQILLERFPYFVQAVLQSYTKDSLQLIRNCNNNNYFSFRLENLDMLLHSTLRSDTIELIFKLNSTSRLFVGYLLKCLWGSSKVECIKKIYYLLSYGMPLYEQDLDDIYKITGYNEDFKNLLFMDLQKQINIPVTKIIPRLLYDVTLDLHNSVRDSYICWRYIDWNQLFDYFAHPKFQGICAC